MEHLGEEMSQLRGYSQLVVPLYAYLGEPKEPVSFHSFHEGDFGWTINSKDELEVTPQLRPPDRADLRWSETAFVQRWLFFEVLRAIFHEIDGFAFDKFYKTDKDNRRTISTEALPEFLKKWHQRERAQPDRRLQRLVHAQQVLDSARGYASHFSIIQDNNVSVLWPIKEDVAFSILVLGETLSRALKKIQEDEKVDFKISGWHSLDQHHQGWGYSKLILKLLEKRGWRPDSVKVLRGLLRNNTIGLLCALCVPEVPKSRQSSQAEPYRLYHHGECGEDCSKPIGPSESQHVGKIIRDGRIPLFRYSRETGALEIVAMNGETFDQDYAIFSHVWSDGFGNPETNKMNRCVLELFAELFDNIQQQRSLYPIESVSKLFWIDTLAVPIGDQWSKERKEAIQRMHDIYAHANYTIVLDRGLMAHRRESGYATPAMRIALSAWISRLWTLQEAVLSKHLYFNFNNEVYPMDRLESFFEEEDGTLDSSAPALGRTYYHSILGSDRQRRHKLGSGPLRKKTDTKFVANVWKATQWRTTEHRVHETLALATLFNLDTDSFADASNTVTSDNNIDEAELDFRMQKLLSLLSNQHPCPIPSGMIFLPGPRLSGKGFRWAPRTWLSGHPVEYPDPLSIDDKHAQLRDGEGLDVRFPGFRLHELEQERSKLHLCGKSLRFPVDKELHEWYTVEHADKGDIWPRPRTFGKRKAAIICPRSPVSHQPEIALLVAIVAEKRGSLFADILLRVRISRELREDVLAECKSRFRKEDLDGLCYGETLSQGQQWCVDGPEQPPPEKPLDTMSLTSDTKRLASRYQFSTLTRIFAGRPRRQQTQGSTPPKGVGKQNGEPIPEVKTAHTFPKL